MARKFGRYDERFVTALQLNNDLVNKPRGGNNNKDGRAFELAHGTYMLVREIAVILNVGKSTPMSFEELRRYSFNERPICLVDDFELLGTFGHAYSQLKVGAIPWKQLIRDFRNQIALDKAQGLKVTYHLAIGSPRNLDRVEQRLRREELPEVVVTQYNFPELFVHKLVSHRELSIYLEAITGTEFVQLWESVHQTVLCRMEETRQEVSLVGFVRKLHEKDPHLFHPLEELHDYDFILELLRDCAPDVVSEVRGPTLWLTQEEACEVFTIPWGVEEEIAAFEGYLCDFIQSAAEEYLNIAEVIEKLEWSGWQRAAPRRRSRAYVSEDV